MEENSLVLACSAALPPSLKLRRTAEALAKAVRRKIAAGVGLPPKGGSHTIDLFTGLKASATVARHSEHK